MIIHNQPFEENMRQVVMQINQSAEKYEDLELRQLAQDLDILIKNRQVPSEGDMEFLQKQAYNEGREEGYDDGYDAGYEAGQEDT